MQKKPCPIPSNNKNVLLLCQSKRFPGEYYCFNTVNGEAMWCRSEDRSSIAKSCDEDTHAYPEPCSPPHSFSHRTDQTYKPSTNPPTAKFKPPTFGAGAFTSYLPVSENVPSYTNIWAGHNQKVLLAPAVPIFMPSLGSYPNIDRIDRNTQTSRDTSPIIVETTQVPMSRRVIGHFDVSRTVNFGNRQTPNFTQPDRVCFKPITENQSVLKVGANVDGHIPLLCKRRMSEDSGIFKKDQEPIVKLRHRTRTVSNMELSSISFNEMDNCNQATPPAPDKDKIILGLNNVVAEVHNEKTTANEAEKVLAPALPAVPNLAKDDLRHRLLARRRKTTECPQTLEEKETTNAMAKVKLEPKPDVIPVGKKVTFDFDTAMELESISGSCEEFYEDLEGTYADPPMDAAQARYNTAKLRSLAGGCPPGECWHIAADVDVLLDSFGFIEELLHSDEHCRLMMPTVVRSQLAFLCGEPCVGSRRSRVLAARWLSRRLATAGFVVQEEKQSVSNEADSIIDCCKRFNVILITNRTVLHAKAASKQLTCLTLEAAKKTVKEIEPVHFDAKEIQITVKNFTATKEDVKVFLQNEILENSRDGSFATQIRFKQSTPLQPTRQTEGKETPNVNRPAPNRLDAGTCPMQSYENNWYMGEPDLRVMSPILGRKPKVTPELSHSPLLLTKDFRNTIHSRSQNGTLENVVREFESKLRRFTTFDVAMEEKLVSRKDEYLCRFIQILEEALASVLFSTSSSPVPEALGRIAQLYAASGRPAAVALRLASDEIASLFVCPPGQKDFVQLKQDVDSKDLMRILGSGVILIRCLIELHPASESLYAAEKRLQQLLSDSRDPGSTPDVSISDYKIPPKRVPEDISLDDIDRPNVMKKPAEVVDYLKRHFPAWQDYDRPGLEPIADDAGAQVQDMGLKPEEIVQNNVKIIRTCGRELGRLRLKPHTIQLEAAGPSQRDDFTSDSGICRLDEMHHAKPLADTLLREVSGFYMAIYGIVKSTVNEFQDGTLLEDRKRVIRRKVKKIQGAMHQNRTQLQRIVEREGTESDSTLKMLVTKAGIGASNIKLTRYRQVIMKLLEQANILDGCLQTVAQLANGTCVDEQQIERICDVKHINIFDA